MFLSPEAVASYPWGYSIDFQDRQRLDAWHSMPNFSGCESCASWFGQDSDSKRSDGIHSKREKSFDSTRGDLYCSKRPSFIGFKRLTGINLMRLDLVEPTKDSFIGWMNSINGSGRDKIRLQIMDHFWFKLGKMLGFRECAQHIAGSRGLPITSKASAADFIQQDGWSWTLSNAQWSMNGINSGSSTFLQLFACFGMFCFKLLSLVDHKVRGTEL